MIEYCCIDGSIVYEDWIVVIDEYNVFESEKFVFFFIIWVGGLGINFVIVDIVVFFDLDWWVYIVDKNE